MVVQACGSPTPRPGFCVRLSYKMSERGGRMAELKLNVPSPAAAEAEASQRRRRRRRRLEAESSSSSSSSSSEPSSCVSSEPESAGPAAAMVLAACPRCLMYVMLWVEDEPKCPRCSRDVLLDFLAGGGGGGGGASKKANELV